VNAIFPRHVGPVVRQSDDGEREIILMSWSFMRLETMDADATIYMAFAARQALSGSPNA
jgi:hypothetical protein